MSDLSGNHIVGISTSQLMYKSDIIYQIELNRLPSVKLAQNCEDECF